MGRSSAFRVGSRCSLHARHKIDAGDVNQAHAWMPAAAAAARTVTYTATCDHTRGAVQDGVSTQTQLLHNQRMQECIPLLLLCVASKAVRQHQPQQNVQKLHSTPPGMCMARLAARITSTAARFAASAQLRRMLLACGTRSCHFSAFTSCSGKQAAAGTKVRRMQVVDNPCCRLRASTTQAPA